MEEKMNLVTMLLKLKNDEKKGVWFIESRYKDVFVSYKELYESVRFRLFNLQRKGLKPKDKIILPIENNYEFLVNFWACVVGGIIPIPCSLSDDDQQKLKILKIFDISSNPFILLTEEKLVFLKTFMSDHVDKRVFKEVSGNVILSSELQDRVEYGDMVFPSLDDIAFIQFSSGSTGNPKGVILTHNNIYTNLMDCIEAAEITQDDSSINWMPLTHDLGLIKIHLGSLCAQINQFIMTPQLFLKRPTLWMEKVSQYKITQLYTTNYGVKLFLDAYRKKEQADWDLKQVRFVLNAAEPISAKLSKEFLNEMNKYGMSKTVMLPAYGLAEATVGVASYKVNQELNVYRLHRDFLSIGDKIEQTDDDNHVEFVEIGFPVKHTSLRICDSDGAVLKDNHIGRIQIKGENVTQGYLNDEANSICLFSNDGWLNTGDIGFLNNGRLTVTGREKDLLIINGVNYYPHDIERLAEATKLIELNKVAAVGVYNPELFRDELLLFVVYKKTIAEFVELSLFLKKEVGKKLGFQVSEVLPVKNIPKTTSGKLQRFYLKEQYEKGKYSEVISQIKELERETVNLNNESCTQLEKEIISIWVDAVGDRNVTLTDEFLEVGGDSFKAVKILNEIESKYGLDIEPLQLINELNTPKKIADFVSDYLKQKQKQKNEESFLNFNF